MERIAPDPRWEPEEPEKAPEERIQDAEFTIRKKPLRYRLFKFLDPEVKAKKGKVRVWTIRRVPVDYGCGIEYEARPKYVKKWDLPAEAVHLTGKKGEYVFVDMEPVFPEYADPEAERDEDGNYVRPHNYFDAFGYFQYFTDIRIRRGYEALGHLDSGRKPLDWKTIGVVAVVVVIVLAVIMMFYGGK